jgi:hypothetical protein
VPVAPAPSELEAVRQDPLQRVAQVLVVGRRQTRPADRAPRAGVHVVVRVALAHRVRFAGLHQALGGVLADRLEQAVARLAVGGLDSQEAVVQQRLDGVEGGGGR